MDNIHFVFILPNSNFEVERFTAPRVILAHETAKYISDIIVNTWLVSENIKYIRLSLR